MKHDAIEVKAQAGALSKFDEEMARLAQAGADKEKMIAGRFLSVKGGRLAIAGEPLPNNEAQVVVLASAFENDYFPGAYDPNDTAPPTCYALSLDEEGLAPHVESADPQAPACFGCPHNAWNSAGPGRKGKKCQNRRRLALMAAKDAPNAEKAEVVYMRIPVTSVRNWGLYVKGLAGLVNRPPFAVVTRIKAEPHPTHTVEIKFEYVSALSQEDVSKVMRRVDEQMKGSLLFPYPKATSPAASAPTQRAEKF